MGKGVRRDAVPLKGVDPPMDTSHNPTPSYLALIREFPLHPLQSEADLDAAIAMTHKLIDNRNRDEEETEYLMALGDLIHAYEAETNPLPEIAPLQSLRFLVQENDLTPALLAEQTGLAVATISEILNGAREISGEAREALAKRFCVDPSLFA